MMTSEKKSLFDVFFVDRKRRDELKFWLFKSLKYDHRIFLFLSLVILGLVLQILTLTIFPGILFLFLGILFVLVEGYDSRRRFKSFKPDNQWTEVTLQTLRDLIETHRKLLKWDRKFVDISNIRGIFGFIIVLVSCGILGLLVGEAAKNEDLSWIIIYDSIVIFTPLWLTGMRFLINDNHIALKSRIILELAKYFQKVKKSEEKFVPMMLVSGDVEKGETAPADVKFQVQFPDSPEKFFGVQAQIHINNVQGHVYPYFYCVIVGDKKYRLERFLKDLPQTSHIIFEPKLSRDYSLIVIRQFTTKKSGYHTKSRRRRQILNLAMVSARIIVKKLAEE